VTRQKLKDLLAEYGKTALVTYVAVLLIVFAGFALAIAWGVHVESAAGGTGLLGAAYVATKLTQPLRIAATLALTPIVARVVRRFRGRNASETTVPPAAERDVE
jgi:hypothetical protein